MDRIVHEAVQLVEAKRKTAEQQLWPLDQPFPQACYKYHGTDWHPIDLGSGSLHSSSLHQLDVWSWNIDFMLPFPSQRLEAALRYLQQLIETEERTHASDDFAHVIFLAECLESDISLLSQDTWVRSKFCLTDLDLVNMASGHYGTVALIDRRLAVQSCFRIHYSKTRMERDGLFIDVVLDAKHVRLCTTHAESLALQPAFRPIQLDICARHMHDPLVYASILAGDLNAIEPADEKIHVENDLKDAYLESGGDPASGHTWGQQAPTSQRSRFGTSRMDKVLYCGGVQLLDFQIRGANVELQDERERRTILDLGFERAWITDHLALRATFELGESDDVEQHRPEAHNAADKTGIWHGLKLSVMDYKLWIFVMLKISISAAYGLSNFYPAVVRGFGYSRVVTLVITFPPYFLAAAAAVALAWSSDKRGERGWNYSIPIAFAMVRYIVCMSTTHGVTRYAMSFFYVVGLFGANPLIVSWVSMTMGQTPEKKATSIAIQNVLSNIGNIMAFILMFVMAGITISCAMLMKFCLWRANKKLLEFGAREWHSLQPLHSVRETSQVDSSR